MEHTPISGTQQHRQSPDMPLSHDLATDKLRAGHITAMALARLRLWGFDQCVLQ